MAAMDHNHARNKSRRKSRRTLRSKPGATGKGNYYHIEVRPKKEFTMFRMHDVGKPGGVQRLAGKRENGSWADQKWLIDKKDAHVSNGRLVGDTEDVRNVLGKLGSTPKHIEGDRFRARPRRNIPEREKPTLAQRKARQRNIKKAQAARAQA